MQLKLHKRLDDSPDDSSRSNAGSGLTSPEATTGKGRGGGETPAAILYGDTCEMVAKKVRYCCRRPVNLLGVDLSGGV